MGLYTNEPSGCKSWDPTNLHPSPSIHPAVQVLGFHFTVKLYTSVPTKLSLTSTSNSQLIQVVRQASSCTSTVPPPPFPSQPPIHSQYCSHVLLRLTLANTQALTNH